MFMCMCMCVYVYIYIYKEHGLPYCTSYTKEILLQDLAGKVSSKQRDPNPNPKLLNKKTMPANIEWNPL